MSVNYASALSYYPNKGKVGQKEFNESEESLNSKVNILKELLVSCKKALVLTGAGISTSAGIPDFRGPTGVWTMEEKGLSNPDTGVTFETAQPTSSHQALVKLHNLGYVDFLISQNIDGLHMKSGFPVSNLAELHGNVFTEICPTCGSIHINNKCVSTMTLMKTGNKCCNIKPSGLPCRGYLTDTILDWEDELPKYELDLSLEAASKSPLIICIGTSLQIYPVAKFPMITKKKGGKVVIINLQKTPKDKIADLVINGKADDVFEMLLDKMNITLQNESEVRLASKVPCSFNIPRKYFLTY